MLINITFEDGNEMTFADIAEIEIEPQKNGFKTVLDDIITITEGDE